MATEFFSDLKQAFLQNEPFVLCTVIEKIGSSPGKAGQKMIVYKDGSTFGTVGGGINEERIRQVAVELFESGGSKLLAFDLNNPLESSEPVCGGGFKVFIELHSMQARLVIFGAGHISQTLSKMAHLAKFRIWIVDERPKYANTDLFPEAERIITAPYTEAVDMCNINKDDYIVVMTPGHLHDKAVLEKVLNYRWYYCGMVCSRRKRSEFVNYLLSQGFDKEKIDSINAPIGLKLGSTTPEEIAVEIIAQLVAYRNGRSILFE